MPFYNQSTIYQQRIN